jgi:hypothetical protein
MSAFVHRPLAFAVVGLAAVLSGRALAQAPAAPAAAPAEAPEEITVRGRKTLTQYRVELDAAREELVQIYNEENSSDDNDITCRNERATGTRMPQRVCRSNAQSRAEANASRWFLNALTTSAGRYEGEGGPGAPAFSGGPQLGSTIGTGVAQGDAIVGTEVSRAKIEEELERLKKENRRVYRAAVKYIELEDEYNAARGAVAE